MKRKQEEKPKKARALTLHKETLRAVGGVKIHIPIGFTPNTEPIFDPTDTYDGCD